MPGPGRGLGPRGFLTEEDGCLCPDPGGGSAPAVF